MARRGRETARKIKSRQATLYSSSGDDVSGKKEKGKESKVSKREFSSRGSYFAELLGESHEKISVKIICRAL